MNFYSKLTQSIVIITFLVIMPIYSYAGSSSGNVSLIMVHSGDVVFFGAGPHNSQPSCSINGDQWALSLATEKGRAMFAMLLTASAQNRPVTVVGEHTCNAWGDRESPAYMYMTF